MGTMMRRVAAALVLASGLALVPGTADAATVYVCSAKGVLDRISPPPGGSVRWSATAAGTCVSADGSQIAVDIAGGTWFYFPPYMPDYACGTPQRATETPGYLGMSIKSSADGGATLSTSQFWAFDVAARSYEIIGMNFGRPTSTIGAGVAAHHLFLQCPGDPAASFTFSFTA